MWTFEYTHSASAEPDTVWQLWSDVSRWTEWDTDLEQVTLESEFAAGTVGSLKPKGMDALPFTLTRVEAGVGFSDETRLPEAVLRFDHDVRHAAGGGAAITQRVAMDGPLAGVYFGQLGAKIVLDVPAVLERLAAIAEAQSGGADAARR